MYDILIEKVMEGAKSYKQAFDWFLQISDYTNYSSSQIRSSQGYVCTCEGTL